MSEIEWYLDELFDQLPGTGVAGRRALIEAEYHLRAAAADAMARGLPEDTAEHEAVSRFGPPALVARKLRSAQGAGLLNRAVSMAWLLAGLAGCGLGAANLLAAWWYTWQTPDCYVILSPGCYTAGHACDADHHGHNVRRCRCRVAARPLARRQVRSTDIQSPRIRVAIAAMKLSGSKLAALRLPCPQATVSPGLAARLGARIPAWRDSLLRRT